ncbi:hypothetical protein GW17_00060784 [Ensete ventricosum]|nr:hypothetical protein GW17_00060784 [Ensete ventricosum]RZS27977.1 hypothetical protein BHM03_00061524 [Ensete ventricosum]
MATVECRASKVQSLAKNLKIELEEAIQQQESVEELGETRGELADSRKQLADSQGQLTEAQEQLDDSKDALQVDLLRQAIEDYKKSLEFEMGLVRMGQVSRSTATSWHLLGFGLDTPDLRLKRTLSSFFPRMRMCQ